MEPGNFNGSDLPIAAAGCFIPTVDRDHNHMLTLSLSPFRYSPPPPPVVARRRSARSAGEEKEPNIIPPYEWATNRRATVHSLAYLVSKEITVIRGTVQCRRCERQLEMELDLQEKFEEVAGYFRQHKAEMCHRAPKEWQCPVLPRCGYCEQENSLKPVISPKKRSINWLFLFLGQMIGCCTLEQLKYFCKHTKNHRTGAKNRVLYLTYLNICKQLDPNGPYDL
ncbi:uncharacterized protein LOC127252490 [Andrographis paniculata]|uniref:uncharacterized protein LOC127252490 n=1 Tax=Andrographis paniculata TaxID=175694 RepID=UPI0021E87696|nr:uncharacterized protein LOC127252490 [Andrographis paniculata]